jgi:hypothetical protein
MWAGKIIVDLLTVGCASGQKYQSPILQAFVLADRTRVLAAYARRMPGLEEEF